MLLLVCVLGCFGFCFRLYSWFVILVCCLFVLLVWIDFCLFLSCGISCLFIVGLFGFCCGVWVFGISLITVWLRGLCGCYCVVCGGFVCLFLRLMDVLYVDLCLLFCWLFRCLLGFGLCLMLFNSVVIRWFIVFVFYVYLLVVVGCFDYYFILDWFCGCCCLFMLGFV